MKQLFLLRSQLRTLIRAHSGWSPEVSFEDGVSVLLEQIEHWRDASLGDRHSMKNATALWFASLGEVR